ncbi:MAG: porin family protein [Bacteroidaceae bacterium]|nr:porin family protein [Bacteroidaceae bacterium]
MKKILSITLFAVAMVVAMPANAQLKFGLKGGLNINKVSFSQSDIKSDNQTGFFVGPTAQFTTPVGIAVDGSVLFDQRNLKMEEGGAEMTKHLNYIDIPINVRYQVGLGSLAGVYFATGPQFSFNLDGKTYDLKDLGETSRQYELKKSEFGWNLGAGVRLLGHLEIGYNYCFPLGKTSEIKDGGAVSTGKKVFKSFKNQTHQVSVAYIF